MFHCFLLSAALCGGCDVPPAPAPRPAPRVSPSPAQAKALEQKIAEGQTELTKLERDLADLNADPAEIGEWVRAGDLKVRVTAAEVRDEMTSGPGGGRVKTGGKELAVRVEVAPLSKSQRVRYQRTSAGPEYTLTDDRDRKYVPSNGSNGTLVGDRPVDPDDKAFEDVFAFALPAEGADGFRGFQLNERKEPVRVLAGGVKELRMTLRGLHEGGKEQYRFRISVTACAPDITAAVRGLEQAAGVAADKGEKEKLLAAVEVLKAMANPPPTAAQKKRAERSKELAEQIQAKRDEIREARWELHRTR